MGQNGAGRPGEGRLSGADLRGRSAENPVGAATTLGLLDDLSVDGADGGFESAGGEDSINEMWLNEVANFRF